MRSCRPKEGIISLVLVIALTFIILGFPLVQDQYAYSQSSENNPTVKAAVMGVWSHPDSHCGNSLQVYN
jgi:hypothetical protein